MKNIKRRRNACSISAHRWSTYATVGAAAGLGGVATAEADIHYSGALNQVFNAGYSQTHRQTFALDHGGSFELRFFGPSTNFPAGGFAGFYLGGASLSNQFRGSAAGNARYPAKLGPSATIAVGAFVFNKTNALATLAAGNGYAHSQWLAPGTGFIGFRFNGGAGIEYGWIRIAMTGAPNNSFTLVDYAWADPGTPIVTGQTAAVPEPGSLALLAVGAAGLLAWRKRAAGQAS